MVSYDMTEAAYSFSEHLILATRGYRTPQDFRADRPYILVADDTYEILSVVMLLLESEGYAGIGFVDSCQVPRFLEEIRVEKAANPCSSLRFPSLILLDLMMPVLSGDDLAAWLSQHAEYRHIPLMLMTAHPSIRSLEKLPGVVEILGKPFDIDMLLEKIETHLNCLA